MAAYLDRALNDVQNELRGFGLGSLIWWVDVEYSYDPIDHRAHGWYIQPNTLRIPRWAVTANNTFARIQAMIGLEASMTNMRDVIRHEYGHALRDALGQFDRASPIWGRGEMLTEYPDSYEYYTDRADEDFADTFMMYLRCSGHLRLSMPSRAIRRKWAAMKRAIAAGRRRRLLCSVTCDVCESDLEAVGNAVSVCPKCGDDIDLR